MATLPLPVVGHCRSHFATLYSGSPWSKTPRLPSDLYSDICHTVGDVTTSGLDGHIAIFGYPLFVDTFFEFGVVDNFVYCARITVTLTSDLFGCYWVCDYNSALDDDLLLLPVLSVILKMYKYRCLHSCLVNLPFSVSNILKMSHRWSLS